jgi:hypothetical protein
VRFVIPLAYVVGGLAYVGWALKHGRIPTIWSFLGLSITRATHPVLYWTQIAFTLITISLVAGAVGIFALAAISN